ncbi:MAG TPA: amidohydrolase family protein [Candidatus Binatia bacterium]|jgi:predicted TIM-barrel fold metal-dependent hydrolase
MKDYLVIDADGHVEESAPSLQKYLKPENRGRPLWTSDSWDRDFGKTLGKNNEDPRVQLEDMDKDGIDVQVVYPTRGISLSAAREVDLAVDIAHAYNDWLADFCSTNPDRLKGVALVALQDVDAAIKEARRAVEQLGFVGVMMPTNVLDQDIGHKQFWPFYEEIERLNVGLGFHGGIRASQRMHGRFGSFIAVHTIAFPLECIVALTGYMYSGAPELFPKLRIAALEASCGWMPFLMDRMDEEFEIRGKREAPLLKAKPSEYLTNGQFYCAFELEESTLPYVAERIGSDKLLYSSDYPHWDTSWPHSVRKVTERTDISDVQKRQFLGENSQRFYGFKPAFSKAAA